ncbi:MAG: c-type cytochrome, partial [Gemmatimonadota bacterium]
GTSDRQAAVKVDSTAFAAAAYDSVAAAFDTIHWKDEQAALDRGAVVWAYSCQKCHGERGRGDAGFVLHGDTLKPPSFLALDWKYANDPVGIHKAIFEGNKEGMPHWGLVPLSAKDIDAVTQYILKTLRGG